MEPRGKLRAGGAPDSVWATAATAEASAFRAARAFWAAASAPVAAGATVGRIGWTWAGPCAGRVERALRRAEVGVICMTVPEQYGFDRHRGTCLGPERVVGEPSS